MSNVENTDVATVDGGTVESRLAFAEKAELSLRRVLVALGYNNADKLAAIDLLTSVAAWVSMLQFAKLDTFGRYAQTWWEAFKLAWQVHPTEQATQCATDAMNAFARMFPPTLSDDDRDTINDIAALSEELDKQTEIVAGLVSERETLIRLNEHHASELVHERAAKAEFDVLIGRVWRASGLDKHSQSGGLSEQLQDMRGALDALESHQQAVFEMGKLHIETQQRLTEVTAQRDQFMQAMDRMDGALVPLAKPKRIEPGQLWVYRDEVRSVGDDGSVTLCSGDVSKTHLLLYGFGWVYLGTDKV